MVFNQALLAAGPLLELFVQLVLMFMLKIRLPAESQAFGALSMSPWGKAGSG